jgi:HD-like signal output (HDOD) protein
MALFTTSTSTGNDGPQSTLPPDLQKALAKVTELGSLPEVTAKIVQVVEDEKSTGNDIHDAVQADPSLAAKILKIVNSAFYGLPSQVASLDRAIFMLGLSAVKNLALATSLSRLLSSGSINEQFQARDLWRHSVAVAVCSRMLADVGRVVPPDEAFVAGLVHDMGLLVFQQVLPERLSEIATRCGETGEHFVAVERDVLSADHQALGGVLATRWKFPPALRHTVGYHHEPRSLQPEFQKLAALVYVADTVCCNAQLGFYLSARGQELSDEMLALAHLTMDRINTIVAELPAQVDEAERVLSND